MLQLVSPSGFHVFVGKSARENHMISTELLRGHDWWFHIGDGLAGAHVVLQLPMKIDQAPSEDMEFCRAVARKHSKGSAHHDVVQARGYCVAYKRGDPIGTVRVTEFT